MTKFEYCIECNEPTYNAGKGKGSLYLDDTGPYCDACYYGNLYEWYHRLKAENKRLRNANKHTESILAELYRAMEKHPEWPTDLVHRVAIIAEEAGELVRAALRHRYENKGIDEVRTECIQTAAMCYRLLMVLD